MPRQMVDVSASVNLPLHHKDQRFSSGTGSPGWSRKKGRKTVVVVVVIYQQKHKIQVKIQDGRKKKAEKFALAAAQEQKK